MVLTFFI